MPDAPSRVSSFDLQLFFSYHKEAGMTRVEKLAARLRSEPSAFRFSDFARVMGHYGYEMDQKGRTSGSRVRFYRPRDGRMLIMHSPHPGDEMSAGAIRYAARFLYGEEADDE